MNAARRPILAIAKASLVTLTALGVAVPQAMAYDFPGFGGGAEVKAALAVCANERAPVLEKANAYTAMRHQMMETAVASGVKAGGTVLLGGIIRGMTGGLGVPGMTPGVGRAAPAQNANPMASLMGQMGGPGMGSVLGPSLQGVVGPSIQGANGKTNTNALIATAVVVAIFDSVDTYMRLKQAQYENDARKMALSVDDDAKTQLPVAAVTATQMQTLAECRAQQTTQLKTEISGATNDKDRKSLLKQKSALQSALKTDLDMSDGVIAQQASEAKTFTQGRAMAENKSEADVLGDQAPAYAPMASTTPLKLPALETAQTAAAPGAPAAAEPPPPPPPPSYVTIHPTLVRTAPQAKAEVIMRLPTGRTVVPKGHAADNASWWEIDMAGTPGYVRGSDLEEANGASPDSGKGKGKKSSGPAPLSPPSNIRELNREVIVARNDGPDRLKSLSTDIQLGLGGAPEAPAPDGALAQAWLLFDRERPPASPDGARRVVLTSMA
jgi:hypothetical protein